jgi:hypothetical protein
MRYLILLIIGMLACSSPDKEVLDLNDIPPPAIIEERSTTPLKKLPRRLPKKVIKKKGR